MGVLPAGLAALLTGLAFSAPLPLNAPSGGLAHVANLTSSGIPNVLRWWCAHERHASGPLCVRHEISLQMAKVTDEERRQLQQHRQSLLGESASQVRPRSSAPHVSSHRCLQPCFDSFQWAGAPVRLRPDRARLRFQELRQALVAYCNSSSASSKICEGGIESQLNAPQVRAQQTVEMHEWWCAQAERSSLACERHRLQQRHRTALESSEREQAQSPGLFASLAFPPCLPFTLLLLRLHFAPLVFCPACLSLRVPFAPLACRQLHGLPRPHAKAS